MKSSVLSLFLASSLYAVVAGYSAGESWASSVTSGWGGSSAGWGGSSAGWGGSSVSHSSCTTEYDEVWEEKCQTVFEDKCTVDYKKQCKPVVEQQCETKQEEKCEIVHNQKCSTVEVPRCWTTFEKECYSEPVCKKVFDKQCETKSEHKCHVEHDKECSQTYEKVCKKVAVHRPAPEPVWTEPAWTEPIPAFSKGKGGFKGLLLSKYGGKGGKGDKGDKGGKGGKGGKFHRRSVDHYDEDVDSANVYEAAVEKEFVRTRRSVDESSVPQNLFNEFKKVVESLPKDSWSSNSLCFKALEDQCDSKDPAVQLLKKLLASVKDQGTVLSRPARSYKGLKGFKGGYKGETAQIWAEPQPHFSEPQVEWTTECWDEPREKCWSKPRDVCIDVPREVCYNVPRDECHDVERCKQVPKKECANDQKEVCVKVPSRACTPFQREVCVPVKSEKCDDIPYETCNSVPGKKCEKLLVKRPRKVCARPQRTRQLSAEAAASISSPASSSSVVHSKPAPIISEDREDVRTVPL